MTSIEPKGAVFEQEATVNDWDEDYYPPLAIALYDRSISWMLDAMGAKRGDLVLDGGCGPGVHSIRAAFGPAGRNVRKCDGGVAFHRVFEDLLVGVFFGAMDADLAMSDQAAA